MSNPVFTSIDVDRWLYGALSVDPLLQQYAPGGFWAQNPPEGATFPCVRWWEQSPGRDVLRQDGGLGRVESQPSYVVCLLDRQHGGQVDKVYGSVGGALTPAQNHLELGAKRIYSLLHGRYESVNGFLWFANALSEYQMIEALMQGDFDVMVGFLFQLRVQ